MEIQKKKIFLTNVKEELSCQKKNWHSKQECIKIKINYTKKRICANHSSKFKLNLKK